MTYNVNNITWRLYSELANDPESVDGAETYLALVLDKPKVFMTISEREFCNMRESAVIV